MTGVFSFSEQETEPISELMIEQVHSISSRPKTIDSETAYSEHSQDIFSKELEINQIKEFYKKMTIEEEVEGNFNEIARTQHQAFLDVVQVITGYDVTYIKDYVEDEEIIHYIEKKSYLTKREDTKMTCYTHLELTLKIFLSSAINTIKNIFNTKSLQFVKLLGKMADKIDQDIKRRIKFNEKSIMKYL